MTATMARDAVVVPDLETAGGHGVVLVDDRNNASFQECAERVLDVEIAGRILNVVPGEEDLANKHPVFGKGLVPVAGQTGLANGGQELLRVGLDGIRARAQPFKAGGLGAGGDHHSLDVRL